jgi:hypothetical protein
MPIPVSGSVSRVGVTRDMLVEPFIQSFAWGVIEPDSLAWRKPVDRPCRRCNGLSRAFE